MITYISRLNKTHIRSYLGLFSTLAVLFISTDLFSYSAVINSNKPSNDISISTSIDDSFNGNHSFPVSPSIVSVDTLATGFDVAWDTETIDVDGDGDLDLFGSALLDREVAWFDNGGSSSLTKHSIDITLNLPRGVNGVDLDGDLDIDLLATAFNGDSLVWYENDGSENFTIHLIDSSLDGAREVITADVNGDGDRDVIAIGQRGNEIAWYENDGNESFTKNSIDNNFVGAYSIDTSDIDGDGDIDLLSTAFQGNEIAWYENNGSGTFSKHSISSTLLSPVAAVAGDMDGDGDIDIISAAFGSNSVSWWENDGNESFVEHSILTTADNPTNLVLTDFDKDGDQDIIYTASDNPRVQILLNDGDEHFQSNTLHSSISLGSLEIVDWDMDGIDDIVATIPSLDAIVFLKNEILPAPVSSSDFDNMICDGQSVTFSYSGGTNYEFFVNNISVQNGSDSTFTSTTLSDGDAIKVTVSDGNGCTQTSPEVIISVYLTNCSEFAITGRDITCIEYPIQQYTVSNQLIGATYSWAITGTHVSIMAGHNSNTVTVSFADNGSAHIGQLMVEETNGMISRKDTLIIGVAHPNVCVHTNCVTNTNINSSVLGVVPVVSEFNVAQTLTSDGIIANKDFTFRAGESIELRPGFTVNAGRAFEAVIADPCMPD